MAPSSKRPRLGRGLSSLISSSPDIEAPLGEYEPVPGGEGPPPASPAAATKPAVTVTMLPLTAIESNPFQPRRTFDETALQDLAASIRSHGMLQPVLVAQQPDAAQPDRYHLIAGERRLRAAQRAGIAEIPCILRSTSPQQVLELALIENIHRADLNPLERAAAYRDLMDRFGLSQQQLAEHLGEPRATVANHLRLLDLPEEPQAMLRAGALSFGHAKVLAGLAGQAQAQLAKRTVRHGLSVRQLEQLVSAGADGSGAKRGQAPKTQPPYIADLQRQLTQAVGTKVAVRPRRGRHSGKIVIEYYSLDDFDRIMALLGVKIES